MLTDDCFQEMLLRENHHLPKDDYLQRLQNEILPISTRTEAIDWISMAASHFSFGTLCICLSVNYLDRFLSVYDLPSGKAWTVQLLAVACLSIVANVEETNVPQRTHLQVGEPKFACEAKTIQRMELLVLSTLRWRMSALTPCSFIDYFLNKINKDQPPSRQCISRSLKLIVSTIKVKAWKLNASINFLSYKSSEIAAAIAIYALGDAQVVNPDEPMSGFNHIGKTIEEVRQQWSGGEGENGVLGRLVEEASLTDEAVADYSNFFNLMFMKFDEASHVIKNVLVGEESVHGYLVDLNSIMILALGYVSAPVSGSMPLYPI